MKFLNLIGVTSALFGALVQCSEAKTRPKAVVKPFDGEACHSGVYRKPEGIGHKKKCQKFKHGFMSYMVELKQDKHKRDCQLWVYADKHCKGQRTTAGWLSDLSIQGTCHEANLTDGHGHKILAYGAKLECGPKRLTHIPKHRSTRTTSTRTVKDSISKTTITVIEPEPTTTVIKPKPTTKNVITQTVTGTFEITSEIPSPTPSTSCRETTTTWTQTNTIVNELTHTFSVCDVSGIVTTLGLFAYPPTPTFLASWPTTDSTPSLVETNHAKPHNAEEPLKAEVTESETEPILYHHASRMTHVKNESN